MRSEARFKAPAVRYASVDPGFRGRESHGWGRKRPRTAAAQRGWERCADRPQERCSDRSARCLAADLPFQAADVDFVAWVGLGGAEGVGDALVGGISLPVDAVHVDLEQDVTPCPLTPSAVGCVFIRLPGTSALDSTALARHAARPAVAPAEPPGSTRASTRARTHPVSRASGAPAPDAGDHDQAPGSTARPAPRSAAGRGQLTRRRRSARTAAPWGGASAVGHLFRLASFRGQPERLRSQMKRSRFQLSAPVPRNPCRSKGTRVHAHRRPKSLPEIAGTVVTPWPPTNAMTAAATRSRSLPVLGTLAARTGIPRAADAQAAAHRRRSGKCPGTPQYGRHGGAGAGRYRLLRRADRAALRRFLRACSC